MKCLNLLRTVLILLKDEDKITVQKMHSNALHSPRVFVKISCHTIGKSYLKILALDILLFFNTCKT